MSSTTNKNLLRLVATHGEMPAQELVAKVHRHNNDYTDFYGLAAMLHSGYLDTDTKNDSGGEKKNTTLGSDTNITAISLCQLALPEGESFTVNECPRESWHNSHIKVFITGQGILKLEELERQAEARRQKHIEYILAVSIAILAAIAGGWANSYFLSQIQSKTLPSENVSYPNDTTGSLGDTFPAPER